MVKKILFVILSFFLFQACDSSSADTKNQIPDADITYNKQPDTSDVVVIEKVKIADTAFVDIKDIIADIDLNFVYADTLNFFKTAVYPCEECLLRYEVAIALNEANHYLDSLGYKLQLYDCYRPFSVQEFMWKILPDSRYVANPNKNGSIHNRGGAVDLRLLYPDGDTVPMGTEFDHFGIEASHAYDNLPDSVLANRKLLKEVMEKFGFKALNTEWWHYSYKNARTYPIANISLKCN